MSGNGGGPRVPSPLVRHAGELGALLVLPTTPAGQRGPVGGWISTAGWAAAAERVLGAAWIVTPHGLRSVEEVRYAAASAAPDPVTAARVRAAVPTALKTALKDVRAWRRAKRFELPPERPWTRRRLAFVWQRHELFHSAGLDVAEGLGVPSVLFVPALVVHQAEQWGVRRKGWGAILERRVEVPVLRRADLLACGSDPVAAGVAQLGVDEERILVTPSGVDMELFDTARPARRAVRARLQLGDGFTVGWTGSFRPFHGLDQLVDAVASLGGTTLVLVGDGPERPRIERRARDLGVEARFTGTVPHAEIPSLLSALDVAVVLGRPDEPFHYSPLKLGEYLAAGLPVVAPSVPHLVAQLRDAGASFFRLGDVAALGRLLRDLRDEPTRRDAVGERARAAARAWSWDLQIRRVLEVLERRRPAEVRQSD